MKDQLLGYRVRNVMVSVPKDWQPDINTLKALGNLTQLTLEQLRLNRGLTRVNFVVDARTEVGKHNVAIHNNKVTIQMHPSQKYMAVGHATTQETVRTVAQAVALSTFISKHPQSGERNVEAVRLRADRVARDMIKRAETNTLPPPKTFKNTILDLFRK